MKNRIVYAFAMVGALCMYSAATMAQLTTSHGTPTLGVKAPASTATAVLTGYANCSITCTQNQVPKDSWNCCYTDDKGKSLCPDNQVSTADVNSGPGICKISKAWFPAGCKAVTYKLFPLGAAIIDGTCK